MRIWHPYIIPGLPRQLLVSLHRDLCALRGKSWGRKGDDVEFLWQYPLCVLEDYHRKIMQEMRNRGYKPAAHWESKGYRGNKAEKTPKNWVDETWKKSGALVPVQFTEHSYKCLLKQSSILWAWVEAHQTIISPEDSHRLASLNFPD